MIVEILPVNFHPADASRRLVLFGIVQRPAFNRGGNRRSIFLRVQHFRWEPQAFIGPPPIRLNLPYCTISDFIKGKFARSGFCCGRQDSNKYATLYWLNLVGQ